MVEVWEYSAGLGGVVLAAAFGALIVPRRRAARRLAALLGPAPPGPRPVPPDGRERRGEPPAATLPRPVRLVVAAVAMVAGYALVGGAVGLAAAPLAGCGAFLVVSRAEPRAVRERRERIESGLPVATELLAAALRSGLPPTDALEAVGRALPGPLGEELRTVAERQRLGTDPAAAWRLAEGPDDLHALGRTLARSARTGAPPAAALDRFARDRRRAARSRAVAAAQRASVAAVLPLGLCFLPAFVLIGVVPMAVGLMGAVVLP
ncbi:Flp pilus assembly protein TadB [Allonocardiopsis opalescens]|uniref:Flp pilus assembly protein TadB n=1 Tax=Allonocardiopsis opalescens TaxID=1144618 RepID=A0A2T0Q6Q0_9ACTN|nr:Flp pilus assembly protein TadB [Allonocardiopsis opalescens]